MKYEMCIILTPKKGESVFVLFEEDTYVKNIYMCIGLRKLDDSIFS